MRIAVGGNSRKAGKTSVICGLIRALAEYRWTAVKISPHLHPGRSGDTGRYLSAGAREAVLLGSPPARWPDGNVIIESGAVQDADLYLLVLDLTQPDFKPSAAAMLTRADAFVVTVGEWDGGERPVFAAPPPRYESAALAEFIRRRLQETSAEP
ncbi:MAG TPA: hypothetical protein VN428_20065 [Bryobacteraceae bacterium]|nr:hypothetical protein [Bryobacteraceae bacterium]